MLIKYRNPTTIDVFKGLGWNNWACFKISKKHNQIKYYQIQGIKYNKQELIDLEKHIENINNE